MNELKDLINKIDSAKNINGFKENNQLINYFKNLLEILVDLETFNKKNEIEAKLSQIKIHDLNNGPINKKQSKSYNMQETGNIVVKKPVHEPQILISKFISPM